MNSEFISALHDLEKERGINADVVLEAIEAALISAYKKNFGSAQNVRVEINRATGDIHVYYRKSVVENVEDDKAEISLADAKMLDPDFEIGDMFESEVTPRSFGRIAAQTAKQVVVQRIREAERNLVYDAFVNKEGDIVTGTVIRQENKNVFIDLGRTEALLAPGEQIPRETYVNGERLKVFVSEVRKTTKGAQVLVSRNNVGLLKRLLEMEVPEIYDGIVEIKAAVREPGTRAKVAVYSRNDAVDPVGACVGAKGMRVQSIVNELNGEKLEIVKWSEDPIEFIVNAMSPAKVLEVTIYEKEKFAQVVVPDFQLSLAIGKEGQNARLAVRLTGWKIDIKSESQMEALKAAEAQKSALEELVSEAEADENTEAIETEAVEELETANSEEEKAEVE
ncbi:MAG: transcription termination factor NusA [Clostridia bacterium]|nr:transcription termination factor NusA [Clostridia bacterium]